MKRLILVLLVLSSCGISTPSGYVMGTSSYLQEHNIGRFERLTNVDRKKLDNLLNKIDE